ncbi:MAG TPA: hypothetical protein PLU87_16495 [Sedimentisphaerales bacterium]|nr:hypothetical protein [Sedimentisphaerales bacterium]
MCPFIGPVPAYAIFYVGGIILHFAIGRALTGLLRGDMAYDARIGSPTMMHRTCLGAAAGAAVVLVIVRRNRSRAHRVLSPEQDAEPLRDRIQRHPV